MTDFGDFDPDDALDTEPADPEQVARKLHRLRLNAGWEGTDWNNLDAVDRGELIQVMVVLLDWLRRQGAD